MKKGKTSKIRGYKTSKIMYGTVDSIEFKSLYLNLQTWVEPLLELDNWNRVVLNMSRAIKHSVYESLDRNLFDDKFIVDLDLRSSGLSLNKKSFMNLEVNLFLNSSNVDFKGNRLKNALKDIIDRIYDENLFNNNYFDFHLTKTKKSIDDVKTEKV